jgi:hypothetical protein
MSQQFPKRTAKASQKLLAQAQRAQTKADAEAILKTQSLRNVKVRKSHCNLTLDIVAFLICYVFTRTHCGRSITPTHIRF